MPALQPYAGDPVVVVGNGPVGQTTALLLARWGIPTIVLDARPGRSGTGSRSICQQRDVLDVWDSVGAGRTLAEEGVTWTRARTFYRDHELFCLEFRDPGQSRFPPWVNISQQRTEQVLDERITESALVEPRWEHAVTDLRDTGSEVELSVAAPGGPVTLRTPYVVLAAGGRADDLRSQLGVGFPGHTFDDYFLITDIRTDLPGWERERRFWFDPAWNPGRQVLIHPCPDSTYRIDWQVPGDFDLAAEEASGALDERVRRIVGDRDYEVLWRSVYQFQTRIADRLQVGRVLLAGDCAHLYAPFGARGLNSGVADADNAAWKLAFVLRGWAGDRLLASYHDERHAAALENVAVTTHTMDFLVPQTAARRDHRRAILDRAVRDPAARAEVDSGRLSEPFWYVDSPLTTPDPTRPAASRPPRGELPRPGVGVLLPDLAFDDGARVRDLARAGVLLLVAATDAPALDGVRAPVSARPMGELAGPLGARPGEVWVVRPDAHVAAIVDTSSVLRAVRRQLALDP